MVNRSVPLAGLMDEADRLARLVSAFDAVAKPSDRSDPSIKTAARRKQ
jgi:hypothetical protein